MLAVLALVSGLLSPHMAFAAPFSCQNLFSQESSQGRAPKAPQDRIPKIFDRKPYMIMSFPHDLHPNGRASLFELTVFESATVEMDPITARFVDLLRAQYPESQFTANDKLLVLDILGERDNVLKSLAQQTISELSLDMLGVEAYSLNYKVHEASLGQRRIVFVIKEGAMDYRESLPDVDRLLTQNDFVQWIANELMTVYSKLFMPNLFSFDHRHENFTKAYQVLSRRKDVPQDHARANMSESEFQTAFSGATGLFFASLNGLELLHLRPSFWDEAPVVDHEGLQLFRRIYQGKRSEEFVQNFTREALRLRARLYTYVHRRSGGRPGGAWSAYDTESSVRGLSRLEQDPVFVGSENQEAFGFDFFAGPKHQNTSISDLMISTRALEPLVERLERAGYTELVQLNGADASRVLEQTRMSVADLITVAREAAEHGVYLRYPWQVYFQLSPADRAELKPPTNRSFYYDPRTNTYRPYSENED
jgi:hypothetical protein